jgi:glutaredoxin
MPAVIAPLPDLVLYSRTGCGLCEETRELLHTLLDERAAAGRRAPTLVERDIETDPETHRAMLELIPVVVLGDRRLDLAVSPLQLRRLLADVLDTPAATGG